MLSQNTAVQDAARAEIDCVCRGEPLQYEQVPHLVYLKGIFYEALRVFSTVPNVARLCAKSTTVAGQPVPASSTLVYSITVAALDPKVFGATAKAFDPARHGASADGHEWHPFGPQGPRKCLGYRLAEQEAVTFLAAILARFQIEPASPSAPEPVEYTDATLGPKQSGLYLRFVPR
jgi:cytochrome P450